MLAHLLLALLLADVVCDIPASPGSPFGLSLAASIGEPDTFVSVMAVSPDLDEIARKNSTALRQGLARTSQAQVAAITGQSESAISRFKDLQLEQYAAVLAAVGLKCVPVSMRCVDMKRMEALLVLARAHLEQTKTAEELTWKD